MLKEGKFTEYGLFHVKFKQSGQRPTLPLAFLATKFGGFMIFFPGS